MWVTQYFSLVLLLLVNCQALPTKNLEDNQNAIVDVIAEENATENKLKSATCKRPIVQNKPRILVSYGNVYKQAPIDPMQNILMYFLMNVARDFSREQNQFERRSPGFFSDAKSTFNDITGEIINGSKKFGRKLENSAKALAARESPVESYEETHYYPHMDGTCMCFNRLVRHGSAEFKHEDNVELKGNDINETSTEKRAKQVTDVHVKNGKTTELKIENHNDPVGKEKSTISLNKDKLVKENNTVVRVLKVMDLDNIHLETSKAPTEITFQKQVKKDEDVLNIHKTQAISDNIKKNPSKLETVKLPLAINEATIRTINNSNEDDGYYFLLSSGGTDKRTTASATNARELQHYPNLLPKYEDNLPILKELKESRKKRRRARRHHSSHINHQKHSKNRNQKTKIEILEERFRRREKNGERKIEIKKDVVPISRRNIGSDISVLMLPNELKTENDYGWQTRENKKAETNPPTHHFQVLTVSLPTFLGGGLALLGLCYFLRSRGSCCRLFMDKSNIIGAEANKENRTQNIAT